MQLCERRDDDIAIPPHWDLDDPATWALSVTVSAHLGYHHATGLAVRQLREIRVAATDYEPAEDIAADLDSALWWLQVLGAILDAEAAMAEASPEQIASAGDALGVAPEPDGTVDLLALVRQEEDLEAQAAAARRVARALRA